MTCSAKPWATPSIRWCRNCAPFEIVRRRLFESIPGDQFKHRDVTAQAFSELYRSQSSEFPAECRGSDYEQRIRADLGKRGDFERIHAVPKSSADVPDDFDARLVVLSADHPHTKDPDSPAETAARAILETRGNTPRLYRNTLVFLAADKVRLQDLDDAVRKYLA